MCNILTPPPPPKKKINMKHQALSVSDWIPRINGCFLIMLAILTNLWQICVFVLQFPAYRMGVISWFHRSVEKIYSLMFLKHSDVMVMSSMKTHKEIKNVIFNAKLEWRAAFKTQGYSLNNENKRYTEAAHSVSAVHLVHWMRQMSHGKILCDHVFKAVS